MLTEAAPMIAEPREPERLGYTVGQMARACGLHPDTVRDHCKSGKIRATRIGWQYVIPVSEVRRLFPTAKI